MATIRDVAERANVSIATVSRALNGAVGIGPETLARVMRSVEALNFSPAGCARNLRRRGKMKGALTYALGILHDQNASIGSNLWLSDFIDAIGLTARKRGYGLRLITCDLRGDIPREVREREVDGLVLFGPSRIVREVSPLVPTITIDAYDPLASAFGLRPDWRDGARQATELLLSVGLRRIALTCASLQSPADESSELFEAQVPLGCWDVMRAKGVTPLGHYNANPIAIDPEGGYRLAKAWFSSGSIPEAVLGSDAAMPGIYRAAYEHNLRIPDDLSLIGIDGVSLCKYLTPPLTTVDAGLSALAAKAANFLVDCASKGELTRGLEITPVRLIKRASVRESRF